MRTSLFLLPVLFLAACANLEVNAYRTLATTATVVDATMQGWGDYVKAGKSNADEEALVKKAYVAYQVSMRTARVTVESYHLTKDATALSRVLDALDAAKNALIEQIYSFKL